MKLRKLFTLIAFAHIGISLSAISNLAVAESAKETRSDNNLKVILGVDRLDYTKGWSSCV